ncbi:MAG: DUF4262 domain-containing protein [Pseudonocardiales bacterium]
MDTAVALFGREFRALQLVWADDRGHWPWERGFREREEDNQCSGRAAQVSVGHTPNTVRASERIPRCEHEPGCDDGIGRCRGDWLRVQGGGAS